MLSESEPDFADGLARKSASENINAWGSAVDGSNVVIAVDAGPVSLEDPPAVLISFAEPDGSHASAFESEVQPADAREEGTDIQHPLSLSP